MKKTIPLFLSVLALGGSLTMAKEKPIHERGWIGGEYKVVKVFPPGFSKAPKAAILITALNTNTPASLAGMEAGDLILELNHQPATRLPNLWRTIDNTEQGKSLPVKIWRKGQTMDREIRVGRETYNKGGSFAIALLPLLEMPRLWPFPLRDKGFSVVAAGFNPEPVSHRRELSSAEVTYFKHCIPKNYEPTEAGWRAWLVILDVRTTKRIKSQEIVPSATGSLPKPTEAYLATTSSD